MDVLGVLLLVAVVLGIVSSVGYYILLPLFAFLYVIFLFTWPILIIGGSGIWVWFYVDKTIGNGLVIAGILAQGIWQMRSD